MAEKTRFDVTNENFDLYFARQILNISPAEKDALPKDISFKIFRGGGEFDATSTSKLNFLSRLFVLWKALRKRWWIVVEDEKDGLSPEQFVEYSNCLKRRDYGPKQAEDFDTSGHFILANKELGDAFSYLNRLGTGPSYNYLVKGKNRIPNHAEDWKKAMQYICRFILCYESNKKSWVSTHNVSIPEWLVLIYLYHGKEVNGGPIYKETYKRAYQSSPTKLRRCFSVLQAKGYIQRTGEGRGAKLCITALGIDIVNTILTKYALNC